MKLFILCVLIVVATADRLDNVYLPPGNAKSAGGNGNVLNVPFGSGTSSVPASQYGAPNRQSSVAPPTSYGTPLGNYNGPSGSYGAPSGSVGNGYSNFAQSPEARASILRFNNENNGDGSYRFEYETENKIYQQEAGELKNVGTQQEGSVVEGTYSYVGPDGNTYTVNYIADENGFRASGDHIPTPPPVPEAIQKSLALIAAKQYSSSSQGYNNGQQEYARPNNPSFNQQTGYQY